MSVCLCMIVKNEAHVIERCLRSVMPLVSCWSIVDTGSNDGTQQMIQALLQNIPGQLHEQAWVDFAHNRSESLRLAAPLADYSLVIDADDELQYAPDFQWPPLTHDAYALRIQDGNYRYERMQLVSAARNWRYEGVLHEYLNCDGDYTRQRLEGLTYRRIGGGARSQDPLKYQRDALVLQHALLDAPTNARTVFYLAQSYRDGHEPRLAIEQYQRRAAMGGWAEEVYISLYQIARLMEVVGADDDAIVAAYVKAYDARPSRAEAATKLAEFLRKKQRWASAFLYSQAAACIAYPDDWLFVEHSVYAWQAVDEFAVSAYWVGEYVASLDACEQLLGNPELPPGEVERVKKNLAFARDKVLVG